MSLRAVTLRGLLAAAPLLAPVPVAAQTVDTLLTPRTRLRAVLPLPAPAYPAEMLEAAAGWREWRGPAISLSTPRYELIVATPLSAAWLAAHDETASALRACGAAADTAGRALAPDGPWRATDAFVGGAPLVMFQITPAPIADRPRCARELARHPSVVIRGIALRERGTYDPYTDAHGARMLIDGKVVAPAVYVRAPVRVIATGTPAAAGVRDSSTQLRLYVPAAELAPDSTGRPPAVVVRIWGADTSLASDVAIPAAVVRQAWEDFIPWRLALAPPAPAPPARLALPLPRDGALRASRALYVSGNAAAAARGAFARLRGAPLSADDQLHARVQLVAALLGAGDTTSARAAALDLARDEPCFSFAPEASAAHHALLAGAPRSARCEHSVSRVALRGVMAPGFGQLASGRRTTGAVFAVATTAALGYALASKSASDSFYDRYQSTTSPSRVVGLYDDAMEARARARTAALVGAGLWLLGAAEATVAESRHARAVRRVAAYGASPVARAEGAGISVGLALPVNP